MNIWTPDAADDFRKQRAKHPGWLNWYINRGRVGLNPTKAEIRALSWRRAK